MIDPIIEEVRKHRDEHARRFNYDLDMICKDLRSRHARNVERLKQIRTAGKNDAPDAYPYPVAQSARSCAAT